MSKPVYTFGTLFTFEYIDGDNSYVGAHIEYVGVTTLVDIAGSKGTIPRGTHFERSVLLNTETGNLSFYDEATDESNIVTLRA
jgi:hypothetical protein